MPFPIMTDEEMQAADETTLRERVRELSTATARLTEIRDILQKCHGILATLLMIATDTPRFDHIDRRSRPRKRAKRKTKGRK